MTLSLLSRHTTICWIIILVSLLLVVHLIKVRVLVPLLCRIYVHLLFWRPALLSLLPFLQMPGHPLGSAPVSATLHGFTRKLFVLLRDELGFILPF